MILNSRSKRNLDTCIPDALVVCEDTIKEIGFTVFKGHKGMEEQNDNFLKKLSGLEYPKGRHNPFPSLALDFYPSPFNGNWEDDAAFENVARIFIAKAAARGIVVAWGGDWKKPKDTDHLEFISKNGIPYEKHYLKIDP